MAEPTTGARVLLLTGLPGTGKTTVVRAVPALLPGWRLTGFTTGEIREGGRRLGFRGTTLDGHESVIAHVSFSAATRVGKYGVDVAAIDALARVLDTAHGADAYVVDEIGKMECLSEVFVAALRRLLAVPVCLVATVASHGGGLIADVKAHPGAVVWEVTGSNRELLPLKVVEWLQPTR